MAILDDSETWVLNVESLHRLKIHEARKSEKKLLHLEYNSRHLNIRGKTSKQTRPKNYFIQ